jgi:dethiobiotin synthetase
MNARSLFVTGTDTGVGKTRVSAALLHACQQRGLRTVGMKPVASGSDMTPDGLRNDDALQLQRGSSIEVGYEEVNPYCFAPAIAPHLAARQAGVNVDLELLRAAYQRLAWRADVVIVEGAGGWRVPLTDRTYISALPRAEHMDVLLVVGLRLGCINHAVLTYEAIIADGCRCVGWVGNGIDSEFQPLQDNLVTLRALLPMPCWGVVPYAPDQSAPALASVLWVDDYLAGCSA